MRSVCETSPQGALSLNRRSARYAVSGLAHLGVFAPRSLLALLAVLATATTGCLQPVQIEGLEGIQFTNRSGSSASPSPSPSPAAVSISPTSLNLNTGASTSFAAAGGVPPYVFSLVSGMGTLSSTSGSFTASFTAGAVVIRVTDSMAQSADATVNVTNTLSISPTFVSMVAWSTLPFSASGGTSPYAFSVQAGGGTIDSASGLYSPQNNLGTSTIQLTDADSSAASTTVDVHPAGQLSLGANHACAVISGSGALSGRVACWGSNSYGQLGGETPGTLPSSPTPRLVPALTNVIQVAAGAEFTCARTSTDQVYCWGKNLDYQLGNNGGSIQENPSLVSVSNVASIHAGGNFACVVHAAASGVSCWGGNAFGQLGRGTTSPTRSEAPTLIAGSGGVGSLALGNRHGCWIDSSGFIKCWGDNNNGQIGTGAFSGNYPTPVTVAGLSTVTQVSLGFDYSCAITPGSELRCWGDNFYGQLGDGTTTDRNAPVAVTNSVFNVSAGANHTCLIRSSGQSQCFGRNGYTSGGGALGDGTFIGKNSPVNVSGLINSVEIGAGGQFSCAREADGKIYCWGYGGPYGALGVNGANESEATPRHLNVWPSL